MPYSFAVRGHRNFFVGALRSRTSSGMTRADGMVPARRLPRCYLYSVAVGQPAGQPLAAQHYFSMRNVLVVFRGQPAAAQHGRQAQICFLCEFEFGSGGRIAHVWQASPSRGRGLFITILVCLLADAAPREKGRVLRPALTSALDVPVPRGRLFYAKID